jgi:8-oxo-dGTP diphosphatase
VINIFVLVLLYTNNETILLLRRSPSQIFAPGLYSLVGGKVERGETALQAIKREVFEEVNLELPESSFKLVHTMHRNGTEGNFIGLFFSVNISQLQTPYNNEPHKHDDMRFFNIHTLPKNIIPSHKQAIECIQNSIAYSEHGW